MPCVLREGDIGGINTTALVINLNELGEVFEKVMENIGLVALIRVSNLTAHYALNISEAVLPPGLYFVLERERLQTVGLLTVMRDMRGGMAEAENWLIDDNQEVRSWIFRLGTFLDHDHIDMGGLEIPLELNLEFGYFPGKTFPS